MYMITCAEADICILLPVRGCLYYYIYIYIHTHTYIYIYIYITYYIHISLPVRRLTRRAHQRPQTPYLCCCSLSIIYIYIYICIYIYTIISFIINVY